MRVFGLAAVLTFALATPAGTAPLDQVPTQSETLPIERHALADCAYLALDSFVGAGLKKVDLASVTQIALESGGTRFWQLILTPVGPRSTRVDLSQAQTLLGPFPAHGVMDAVDSCR